MKTAGVLLVVCACAGMGIAAAASLRKQVKIWEAWAVLLTRLHRELRYCAKPFGELLTSVSIEDLKALPWLASWSNHADLAAVPMVSEEEKPFVKALFGGLGITDLEGQLIHIEQYIAYAEERRQAATDFYRRCAKAYATTGVCAGLGIGIMLL